LDIYPTLSIDSFLVANFHTHPLSTRVGGDQEPSRADKENAFYRGVPGIVISRKGIYSYGPERRESTVNPKGYPGLVQPPAGPLAALARSAPPPWTVIGRQWPEGVSQSRAFDEEAIEEATDETAQEESDVIIVEWSSDDVEYGEKIEDKED
jgi:hypothetical protein